ILSLLTSPDPKERALGNQLKQFHIQMNSQMAGGRDAADQNVKHAQADYMPPGAEGEIKRGQMKVDEMGENPLHYMQKTSDFSMSPQQWQQERERRKQALGSFKQAIKADPNLTWDSYFSRYPRPA